MIRTVSITVPSVSRCNASVERIGPVSFGVVGVSADLTRASGIAGSEADALGADGALVAR